MFLFGADPYRRSTAFLSGPTNSNLSRCIIVLGGQGDGFFSLNFIPQLVAELGKAEWCLVQTVLSSSTQGHPGNHIADAMELDELVGILVRQMEMKEIGIFAYSSGIQVALRMLESGSNKVWISRVILQGVVRKDIGEEIFTEEHQKKLLNRAEELARDGRGGDCSEMSALYDLPISAGRVSKGGILSLQEGVWAPSIRGQRELLRENLRSITCPLLVMLARQVEGEQKEETQRLHSVVKSAIEECASTKDVQVAFFDEVCDERRRMLNTAQAPHTSAVVMFLMEQDAIRNKREEEAKQREADEMRRSRSILAKSSLQPLSLGGKK